ncbi:hypothetical protein PVE_R2G0258 [Pseudomonas veronii 1YdBTEX2]|uniref:Uncharacterized protein n=1 Tax=Pseudomonas veronii 1YdBTEX2 TaxID=1295141 RepID=A0A1D3K7I9_PSEVE|nr:hypothetical protein PVE_R2G0258 [Pseudomonas veronii 1YdBTEX2]
MATALILTDVASEAFHTQQILSDFFDKVRACNTLAGALREMADSKPDLVIVFGLEGFSSQPFKASALVITDSTASMLMCVGPQVVGNGEPERSVRIVPPLNMTNVVKAIHELGLAGIVNQSSLNKYSRPTN